MSATVNTSDLSKLSLNEPQIKKLNETKQGDEVEEILRDNTRRFCLFPIKYHEVSTMIFHHYIY
jgi:ribonucleoside-diphosphate reductase subunit M2